MKGRSLENLQKRYNFSAVPGTGPKGPQPGGKHAPKGMGGKPKNTKKILGRVFSYINEYKLRMAVVVLCMLLLCVLIASLRVLCGQHYPGDVLAALLLSSVISLIGYVLI